MKPIIGITSDLEGRHLSVSMDNINSVVGAGAVPIVLPNLLDEENIDLLVEKMDGLLITGGNDVDPTLFGEEPHPNLGSVYPERDAFEISIIKKALDLNKPILAICRGCQVLSIAAGGDIYQDIHAQYPGTLLQHSQKAPIWHASHFVDVKKDSLLFDITQTEKFKVNSFHHQAVRKIPDGFDICASSSDGVIEAFESKKNSFVIGVQWHPECMTVKKDGPSLSIFDAFIDACKNKKNEVISI